MLAEHTLNHVDSCNYNKGGKCNCCQKMFETLIFQVELLCSKHYHKGVSDGMDILTKAVMDDNKKRREANG